MRYFFRGPINSAGVHKQVIGSSGVLGATSIGPEQTPIQPSPPSTIYYTADLTTYFADSILLTADATQSIG